MNVGFYPERCRACERRVDDEEIVRLLTSIKGIGRWTAEMFLIFYLGRQDIVSLGDFQIIVFSRECHKVFDIGR